MVVEYACIKHQARHYEGADGSGEQLSFVCETPGTPNVEKSGGDLNAVEAATNITIENLLAEDRPNHLSTRFDVQGVD